MADLPTVADDPDRAATRTFVLSAEKINGRSMDPSRADVVTTPGSSEVWELINPELVPHNFHLHDMQFRVLSVDGLPPQPMLAGLKDTVALPAGSRVRLLVTIGPYTDPTLPYMFHCHILTHEDNGMMGQLLVVEEGDRPDLEGVHAAHGS